MCVYCHFYCHSFWKKVCYILADAIWDTRAPSSEEKQVLRVQSHQHCENYCHQDHRRDRLLESDVYRGGCLQYICLFLLYFVILGYEWYVRSSVCLPTRKGISYPRREPPHHTDSVPTLPTWQSLIYLSSYACHQLLDGRTDTGFCHLHLYYVDCPSYCHNVPGHQTTGWCSIRWCESQTSLCNGCDLVHDAAWWILRTKPPGLVSMGKMHFSLCICINRGTFSDLPETHSLWRYWCA